MYDSVLAQIKVLARPLACIIFTLFPYCLIKILVQQIHIRAETFLVFISIRTGAHQAVKILANINFQWFHQALTTLISLRQPFLKLKVSSNGRRFISIGNKRKNSRATDAKSVRVVDWNIGGKNEMSLDSVLVQEMTNV